MASHVQTVKERVEAHLARELHDVIGGKLTGLKMVLRVARRAKRAQDDEAFEQTMSDADAIADETIDAAHRIAHDLRPSILDVGIIPALVAHAREFEKHTGIPCTVTSKLGGLEISPDHAIAIFRICQEGLTNISKHADATKVTVQLERDGDGMRLIVTDDGVGMAANDRLKPNSFGLLGMKERASALGGELSVFPGPKGGTVISFFHPAPS